MTGAALRVHARIQAITEGLWGDLPADDLATAGRVLAIVTERANAELARQPPGSPRAAARGERPGVAGRKPYRAGRFRQFLVAVSVVELQ